ncbi:hypothetical protein Rhal01_03557 [Rubritalea halochordaticola]|uniref:Methyltransferase domain-containing protein n=1 Tax=Rubritalea halochordaticola TaxID=714537 RepID=A0ABP9V3X5_9BACT
MSFPKPLMMAQQIVRGAVREGGVAVDATLGNGHDALFLAKLVGKEGKVYGFDVQEEAITASNLKVQEAGVECELSFHCRGHEHLAETVQEPVQAVMFNLGYLPRADKAVITTVETTLPALGQACDLLEKGGVISVMCYPGHEGGDVEAQDVLKWASSLPREGWRVIQYGFINAPNNPPFLVAIEKLSA